MANQTARLERIVVFNGNNLIVDARVKRIGHKARANALNFMGASGALRKHGRARRLNGDNLHVGVLGFQICANASHRAARAHARNEDIDLALGIVPNFRTRGFDMGLGICGIGELARDEAVRNLGGEFFRLRDSALHAFGAIGKHQFGTVSLHEQATLDRHGLGHRDDESIAASRSNRSQADTRIATRGLDNHGIFVQLARSFGIVKHRLRDTIFHGTSGIEVLELYEHLGLQVEVLLNIAELQKRRVANKLINRGVYSHGNLLL